MNNKILAEIDELRFTALDLAIKSNCGTEYTDNANIITNPDKIVEAAKKFEAYLKDINNG